MELDRGTWQRSRTRLLRVTRAGELLRWGALLLPLVAWLAFPGFLLEALLLAVAMLALLPRLVLRLGAGGVVGSVQTMAHEAGAELTRRQVEGLLRDGVAQGDGLVWVTLHEDSHVRLAAEGRAPGEPPRSSSPWVWAMGGGGI